jgi:nucleoside-diphosphate-sugar epimerase
VVYASSSAIYGNLSLGNDVTNKFSILSPYAQDKLTIEHYAQMVFESFKISSVGLRLFNVYGPGQKANSPYSSVIPIFINKMIKNKPIIINGGFQTRDFIFISDVVDVMIKSMKKIEKINFCNTFNLGTGRSVTINKLFYQVKKMVGGNSKLIKKKLEKHDPKKSSGTFKKINKFLNIKNKNFMNIDDGLVKTISYFKKEHKLKK